MGVAPKRGVWPAAAAAVFLAAAWLSPGCSWVRFEKGPYVVRDLRVVYSAQEDVTFFVWRLRDDAKLDLVDFELYRRGSYRPIALSEAPFPAKPYQCDGNRICFQYQVRGEYTFSSEHPPIRSEHVDAGYFAGPNPQRTRVEKTFDVEPVGIANNQKIDPQRFDWFAQNGVPMRRDYQWQFVERDGESCASSGGGGWRGMSGKLEVDYAWVESPKCFASRPVAEQGPAVEIQKPLPPSAETVFEKQKYVPERLEPTIVYGIVFDLSIPSDQRCEQVTGKLESKLRSAIQSRGDHRELGIYTPISPETGQPTDGCEQAPRRRLPLSAMVRDARRAKATLTPPDIEVLWIYVNNIEIRPEPKIQTQLGSLTGDLGEENNVEFFTWAIASNAILAAGNWNFRTGWRPIGDDTLAGDIRSFAQNYLPFSTMDHESETEVKIDYPKGLADPVAFKICQSTPVPVSAIGIESGRAIYGIDSPHVPWPAKGKPFYRVELRPQRLVPYQQYVKPRVDIVVEACDRFCSNPFKTRGGQVYANWKQTPDPRPLEVCQWRR